MRSLVSVFDFGNKMGCRRSYERSACVNLPPTRIIPVWSRKGLSDNSLLFACNAFPFARSWISWTNADERTIFVRWVSACLISITPGRPVKWLSLSNLKEYETILRSIQINEYRSMISLLWAILTRQDILRISSSSCGCWNSSCRQVFSSWWSHSGPVFQRRLWRNSFGNFPLESWSDGLSCVLTCLQSSGPVHEAMC